MHFFTEVVYFWVNEKALLVLLHEVSISKYILQFWVSDYDFTLIISNILKKSREPQIMAITHWRRVRIEFDTATCSWWTLSESADLTALFVSGNLQVNLPVTAWNCLSCMHIYICHHIYVRLSGSCVTDRLIYKHTEPCQTGIHQPSARKCCHNSSREITPTLTAGI